eukprot:GILJ01013448.1.p1 GENE.GILJ01013448.1~~GILJ01013448.1.p1  ORF type:complete len:201 (-),score=25.18 GILJ01013448.1:257-859(-)
MSSANYNEEIADRDIKRAQYHGVVEPKKGNRDRDFNHPTDGTDDRTIRKHQQERDLAPAGALGKKPDEVIADRIAENACALGTGKGREGPVLHHKPASENDTGSGTPDILLHTRGQSKEIRQASASTTGSAEYMNERRRPPESVAADMVKNPHLYDEHIVQTGKRAPYVPRDEREKAQYNRKEEAYVQGQDLNIQNPMQP